MECDLEDAIRMWHWNDRDEHYHRQNQAALKGIEYPPYKEKFFGIDAPDKTLTAEEEELIMRDFDNVRPE